MSDPTNSREIFTSYSSIDHALAKRIAAGLKAAGQQLWLDVENIRYSDDWRDAVFPAIERAPALLFVTSHASLASTNCMQELEYAAALGKRIIPIVAERVEELPETLRNRVRRNFLDPAVFDAELARLLEDITRDPEYVDIHSQLAYRAARSRAGESGLLDASDTRRARAWLATANAVPSLEPRPTEIIRAFIDQSARSIRRRRVRTVALAIGSVLLVACAYLGYLTWQSIPRPGIELQLASANPAMRTRVEEGVTRLRTALLDSLPAKRERERLLVATWNIRELGRKARPQEALHYIAEIISHFDIVAVQEVKANVDDFDRIQSLLGPHWDALASDVNEQRGGSGERLAFLFDTRKVARGKLVGELGLPDQPEGLGGPFRSPHFASFVISGRELALCNVHIRWGRERGERTAIMGAIADALKAKVERGREFPRNLILLGDVQGGSVDGGVLAAIEDAGFLLPGSIRDLSSSSSRSRPYDQIALHLSVDGGFSAGTGGVFNYYDYVYRTGSEQIYAAEAGDFTGRNFESARTLLVSDHLPKWLEIRLSAARN